MQLQGDKKVGQLVLVKTLNGVTLVTTNYQAKFSFSFLQFQPQNSVKASWKLRRYFAQILMSLYGKKVVVKWCVQSVVHGSRRFAPFFLKSHVLGFFTSYSLNFYHFF